MKLKRIKVFHSVKAGGHENVSLAHPEFELELIDQIVKATDKNKKVVYIPLTNIPYFITFEEDNNESVTSKSSPKGTAPKKKVKAKVAKPKLPKAK